MTDYRQKFYFAYNVTQEYYYPQAYVKPGPAKAHCTSYSKHGGDKYQVVTCMLVPTEAFPWPKK